MKKIYLIIILVFLGGLAWWYFIREESPPAVFDSGQEETTIPDFDSSDYLDDAIRDLEAIEGL